MIAHRLPSRPGPHVGVAAFTLVEIIVSLGIIAVGVLGLMSTYVRLNVTSMAAQETAVATNAARAKVDEIGGMTFSRVVDTYEGKVVPFSVPGFFPDPAGRATALRVGDAPTVLEVTVTLLWEGAAGPRTAAYQTRMTSH